VTTGTDNVEAVGAERFALRTPFALSKTGFTVPTGLSDVLVQGIARLGATAAGDLCFCDRPPGNHIVSVPAGTIIFCPKDMLESLGDRFAGAHIVPLDDPRAAFIDLGHKLLAANEVGLSFPIRMPFGSASAMIGEGTIVHPEARIDAGVRIGANCVIHRGVWLQEGVTIRDNSVIGSEGINAYRGADGRQRGFPHFAGVIVGEGVEIGSGVVVVRGILNSTRIGAGSVIGNLTNIGHGVEIGDKVWMSVGCLVGGHTRIGSGATLGMGVVVRDNIKIGRSAQIGMASVVLRNVDPDVSVFGNPARVVPRIQAGPDR
jgi:UDP-3-O-[3-hydroxymyristoyl] glucosamine N-acyltransferase